MNSTKQATKAMVSKAIGEAASTKQGISEQAAGMAKGELVIVAGMSAGLAMTLARVEQAAAKSLAKQGRTMATPNADAFGQGVHKVKVTGTKGIGGRADHEAMVAHVAGWLADEANKGPRGWSAVSACRDCQAKHKGSTSWPIYRGLFADAVVGLGDAHADGSADGVANLTASEHRAMVIERAKSATMVAGLGYGQAASSTTDEQVPAGTFADRFAAWCQANAPEAAKALLAIDGERAAAKAASEAKANERAAAKAKAATLAKQAATKAAKASKATTSTKAATKATSSTTKAPAAKRAPRAKAATK